MRARQRSVFARSVRLRHRATRWLSCGALQPRLAPMRIHGKQPATRGTRRRPVADHATPCPAMLCGSRHAPNVAHGGHRPFQAPPPRPQIGPRATPTIGQSHPSPATAPAATRHGVQAGHHECRAAMTTRRYRPSVIHAVGEHASRHQCRHAPVVRQPTLLCRRYAVIAPTCSGGSPRL